MDDKPLVTVTAKTLAMWLFLGLPGAVLWGIGGLGALSLLGGLADGSVTPGGGSSAHSLGLMWGSLALCAVAGVIVGMGSLFYRVRTSVLASSAFLGFASLFFSVLT
jgi:hypothetical protein